MCVCGGGGGGWLPQASGSTSNVGKTGHASAEDTIFLGGSGACSPGKCLKIEILKMLEKH